MPFASQLGLQTQISPLTQNHPKSCQGPASPFCKAMSTSEAERLTVWKMFSFFRGKDLALPPKILSYLYAKSNRLSNVVTTGNLTKKPFLRVANVISPPTASILGQGQA
jgi:hypothetical protein